MTASLPDSHCKLACFDTVVPLITETKKSIISHIIACLHLSFTQALSCQPCQRGCRRPEVFSVMFLLIWSELEGNCNNMLALISCFIFPTISTFWHVSCYALCTHSRSGPTCRLWKRSGVTCWPYSVLKFSPSSNLPQVVSSLRYRLQTFFQGVTE